MTWLTRTWSVQASPPVYLLGSVDHRRWWRSRTFPPGLQWRHAISQQLPDRGYTRLDDVEGRADASATCQRHVTRTSRAFRVAGRAAHQIVSRAADRTGTGAPRPGCRVRGGALARGGSVSPGSHRRFHRPFHPITLRRNGPPKRRTCEFLCDVASGCSVLSRAAATIPIRGDST